MLMKKIIYILILVFLSTPAFALHKQQVDQDLHNYDWTNVDATDLKVGSITQAWDADLDDLADGTLSKTKVQDYANWDSAYSHISADGSSHTFIDQSVVSGATPTFTGTNITGINGEYLGDDTVDDDSLDFADITLADFTNDITLGSFVGQTAWRVFYSNADGDVTELALGTDGQVLTSAGVDQIPAFEDATGGGGAMTSFQAEDGDGTEITIDDAKEWKFVEGAGIDINWTDVSTGSDADPYDLTIAIKGDYINGLGADTLADADEFIFYDDTGGTADKITWANLVTAMNTALAHTDTDDQKIDVASLIGTVLNISLESDGEATKEVELSSLQDGTGTDDQTIDVLSLGGTTLSISLEGDGEANKTVDLAGLQDGTGTDDQTLAEVLASGADANDVSITSLAKLEGFDNAVYLDLSANGNADLVADTNIDLNSPQISYTNATKPKKVIYLSASGATIPVSGYAEPKLISGTNFPYSVLAFDTSVDEKCFWQFPVPNNWDGSTVTVTYYWTADAGAGTVAWEIDSDSYANDAVFKTGALGGTAVETVDTLIATGDMHVITSGAFTTSWVAGQMATVALFRDVSSDTLTGDAYLIGISITIGIDEVDEG